MASENAGIIITQPGVSIANAKPSQITLDTSHPFIKIDTQNNAGFQTINMLITNNPPEPSGGSLYAYTVIYKFKHNYTYVPSLETLFYVNGPGAATANTQAYFMDSGQLSAHSVDDGATLYAVADNTYVYFIVQKYLDTSGGFGSPNDITGTTVQVTTHVFVEDVGV